MNKRLCTNNKELQPLENFPHIEECTVHDRIEQVGIGRLVPSYPSYLDQYLSAAGEMHLHVGWLDKRPIGMGNSIGREIGREIIRDYCIVLEKLCSSGQDLMELNRLEATHGKVEGKVLPTATNSNKLTVLISVFEATDDSQDVEMRIAPMIVRLHIYDECPSLWMQPFDSGLKVLPQIGVIDHELSIAVSSEDIFKQDWEARTFSALFGDTGDNNIIKCTSQVMYEITEHDGNHGVRLLGDLEASPDFFLAIRQPDTSKTVRVAACVPHGFLIDVYHMLLSTLELEPPVIVHDVLYYPYGEEVGKETKDSKGARDTRASRSYLPKFFYCSS